MTSRYSRIVQTDRSVSDDGLSPMRLNNLSNLSADCCQRYDDGGDHGEEEVVGVSSVRELAVFRSGRSGNSAKGQNSLEIFRTDTDTFLTQRFLNGLAELFALNPTFRFFRNDFHDRPHLGFRGRPGFGYGIFHQLINFIFFEGLREILR